MFEVGTYVSYRTEGICVIKDIRTENFGSMGGSEEYYILSPIKDVNSVLYVPVSNELLVSKMLPLLSAEEICALAQELRAERVEWRIESRARNHSFRDIVNLGDRRSLIVLVNTIAEKKVLLAAEGKKITGGDEGMFKRAVKMLFDEFSYTADIENEDMLMQVLSGEITCVDRQK